MFSSCQATRVPVLVRAARRPKPASKGRATTINPSTSIHLPHPHPHPLIEKEHLNQSIIFLLLLLLLFKNCKERYNKKTHADVKLNNPVSFPLTYRFSSSFVFGFFLLRPMSVMVASTPTLGSQSSSSMPPPATASRTQWMSPSGRTASIDHSSASPPSLHAMGMGGGAASLAIGTNKDMVRKRKGDKQSERCAESESERRE